MIYSYKKPTIPVRKSPPLLIKPVAKIMQSLSRKKNNQSFLIQQVWIQIVGKQLFQHCQAGSIKNFKGKKTLLIYCANGSVSMQIMLIKTEIINNLNSLFNRLDIIDIYTTNKYR